MTSCFCLSLSSPQGFLRRDFFALAEIEQAAHAAGAVDPRLDGAVAERFARVGNHQIEIDIDDPAKTAAGFAGAEGAVEGKQIRHRIAVRNIAVRAMQMIAERLARANLLAGK